MKNTIPLPMAFISPQQMTMISNKQEPVQKIFAHLNFRNFTRIDTFELVAMICLSIDGTFESLLKTIIFMFGFNDVEKQETITREEFHLFLDSMFRGIINLGCLPEKVTNEVQLKRYRDRQRFPHLGRRVDQGEISQIVTTMFSKEVLPDKEVHSAATLKQAFEQSQVRPVQMVKEVLTQLHDRYKNLVIQHQQYVLELNKITISIRTEYIKQIYECLNKEIGKIEKEKENGTYVSIVERRQKEQEEKAA